MAFYGDGSMLQQVYGSQVENFDHAASKFFGDEQRAAIGNKDNMSLSYQEARRYAYGE
eukprot:CAMPEP_0170540416 /NCGR_PEP_ID=MMETSP0211-20121228/417_1 /TAXON_ID=311385 /ORGANISM="Pseudokeronopsis sp., Strain OXSARD2" /LENGTH=57 /DNA_ID=CAMNT_0010842817 /DNA_START=426 /DNA_END=599 /DNA_ORIENTATION=+